MKIWAGMFLLTSSLVANAQVACTMPNGRTITLNLSHTCPVGATGAKSLDGQPVQIAQPTATQPPAAPTKSAPTSIASNQQPNPSDGSRVVSRGASAGCANKEAYEQLTKIAVQGDSEAFTRALAGSVITGQCVIFERGTVVFIDDTAILSGLVRIRPKGQVSAYWTAMETISTN